MAIATKLAAKPSVGLMLLGTCLVSAVVPSGAGIMLTRKAAKEYESIQMRNLNDRLRSDLLNFENGSMELYGALTTKFTQLARASETFQLLETHSKANMRPALRQILNNSSLTTFETQERYMGAGILLSIAPNDQAALICRKSLDKDIMPQEERPILEAFGEMAKNVRNCIVGKRQLAVDSSQGQMLREGIKADILLDLFQGLAGIDAMVNQQTFPEDLLDLRTSFMRIFFYGTRVFNGPKKPTSWLLFWMWDNSLEFGYAEHFLKEKFGFYSEVKRESLPASTPPEIWEIAESGDSTFAGRIAPPVREPLTLRNALEQVRSTGVIQSGQDMKAPGHPIFVAFPGSNLSRFIIAGQVETESIERRAAGFRLLGNMLALTLVILALAAAWHARKRLLTPLEELRRSMLKVSAGNFNVQISLKRSDEFGSLAAAFNSMTRALQEAVVLGRFVSNSVLQAIQNNKSVESGKGEHREVTILFSSILYFSELCKEESPEKIFSLLNAHLTAFNLELERFEGSAEVDKVIEDKIMIVFDHNRLGGTAKAANAVLEVIKGVGKRLAAAGIRAPMGLNTGMVIAGILGAPSVRLDHTVIGDPVNLASRLATLAHSTWEESSPTTSGDDWYNSVHVVLSGAFLALCDTPLPVVKLPFLRVKGKTQEVEAYLLKET